MHADDADDAYDASSNDVPSHDVPCNDASDDARSFDVPNDVYDADDVYVYDDADDDHASLSTPLWHEKT
ncbi:hypothetical protein JDF658_21940 [Carboxydocella sp. JDF658]|nr:hypothetical protein JDF658_21940 [Carboxydocella sp. JDF658]